MVELRRPDGRIQHHHRQPRAGCGGVGLAYHPEALFPQSGYLPGDIAPNFTLEDQNGNDVPLSDFAGKYVILGSVETVSSLQ